MNIARPFSWKTNNLKVIKGAEKGESTLKKCLQIFPNDYPKYISK